MDQLDFPFPLDQTAMQAYLTQVFAISAEQDRLREELRLLNEEFAPHLPLRALRAAVKIVLTERKMEDHPKEPMTKMHLNMLCTLVAQHLDRMDAEKTASVDDGLTGITISGAGREVTLGSKDTMEDIIATGTRVTVNMSTGEIT